MVLDVSSSLGSNLSSIKYAANSFIDNLVYPTEYCTVTYSANGGTGTTPKSQTVQKGSYITLPSADGLDKTGFTFGGWNTKTDGTGDSFQEGWNYLVNRNITMYARWIGSPTITTNEVTDITAFSAICGGNVIDDGGSSVYVRGVCWSNNPNPTTNNYKTNDSSGTGSFSSKITGLTYATKYYVRSYAINEIGTFYGNEVNFITTNENTWTQKADFEGEERWYAVGFSIGNKGYIGSGNIGLDKQDFREYNPELNTWTQKANFTLRSNAVGFSIGSKGYIGTGYTLSDSGINLRKDFWEYDPILNTWTQKASFAGEKRSGAVGFSIGDKGYIGTGNSLDGIYSVYKKDFFEYDPTTNKWTQKASFAGEKRSGAVGFSIGDKGYIGTGYNNGYKQDFWEYNPTSNKWTQKADFVGEGRSDAVGFSINNKGYIGTGSGNNSDFWEYDPVSNKWTKKADFSGEGRKSAVGFSIGKKGYIGTGSDGSYYYRDFWEFTP